MSGCTTRVRSDWAVQAATDAGGVTAWAKALGINKSTASRQVNGVSKASPDFIAAVLTRYPIRFEAAFEIVPLADTMSMPSAAANGEEASDA